MKGSREVSRITLNQLRQHRIGLSSNYLCLGSLPLPIAMPRMCTAHERRPLPMHLSAQKFTRGLSWHVGNISFYVHAGLYTHTASILICTCTYMPHARSMPAHPQPSELCHFSASRHAGVKRVRRIIEMVMHYVMILLVWSWHESNMCVHAPCAMCHVNCTWGGCASAPMKKPRSPAICMHHIAMIHAHS